MPSGAHLRFVRVGAVCVAIGLPALARADVWTAEPSVSIGGDYSSNPLVVPNGDSGGAAVVTGNLPLAWNAGVHHLAINPQVRLGASGGASGLGSDGYYLSSGYRAETARLKTTVDINLTDDSSVIRQPDAGTLIRVPIRQYGENGKFSASYDLSELDSVAANLGLTHQRYGSQKSVSLYDFNYDSAGLQYTRLVTEQHAVFISTDVVHYRLPDYGYRTDSVNTSVGLAGVVAQLWQYRLHVGQSRLSTSSSAEHPKGSLYAVQLDRAGERSRLSLSVVQSLQPSGFGTLVLSREATARVDWTASERLKFSLTARRAKTSNEFFTLSLTERRFDSVTVGTEWALTERWNTHVDLTYSSGTSGGIFSETATGRALGGSVGLIRRFSRLSLT
jgi:hypothetical protein